MAHVADRSEDVTSWHKDVIKTKQSTVIFISLKRVSKLVVWNICFCFIFFFLFLRSGVNFSHVL